MSNNENTEMSLKIPAYLRGELSEAESRKIDELAASDPNFMADITFQRSLSNALKSETDKFVPGDMGWARLSKAMNAAPETLPHAANDTRLVPRVWKYAAACLAVTAIGQAGILGSLATKSQNPDARYFPVFETSITSHISLSTRESTTKQNDFTALLIESKGQIIEGPSSLGLYTVKFETPSDCHAALTLFETRPEIIETASSCKQ